MTYPARTRTGLIVLAMLTGIAAPTLRAADPPPSPPDKVYVPYDKLKDVFGAEQQGVFLPYKDFQRLWQAAKGTPSGVTAAPSDSLISIARFTGKVGPKLASMTLELTIDVLADGWVNVPLGLGLDEVAVARASFKEAADGQPLLRVVNVQDQKGRQRRQYVLLIRGKGRHALTIDFVCQLKTQPGLNVLGFAMPAAAITTLELVIPEQNMNVDVRPMLAATTSQETVDGVKSTRLQTFLGSAESVELSWKPTTQAAAELEPVIISNQLQHIDVGEALITHEVKFSYDIRRRGVDEFTIQLPGGFRVTVVEGANISKWDITPLPAADNAGHEAQLLKVALFTAAKDAYALTVRMERFLKDARVRVPLEPVTTRQVLRRTGLVAISRSPRRSVELDDAKGLARVDTGRLPENLRSRTGAMAYRFITADYSGTLAVDTVEPRITTGHYWVLGVGDAMELRGRLAYTIERTGVFRIRVHLPEPWELVSVGPANLVDDHQISGTGADRQINILLKHEVTGSAQIEIHARAPRSKADDPVVFRLPLPDKENLHLYTGQLMLQVAPRLRAEVDTLEQLAPLPWDRAHRWTSVPETLPAMAFEFRAIDLAKPAGATFKIAVKPSQVSASVHRLVNIQPGAVEDSAVIDYRVLYAPVDTFYVQVPAALDAAGVELTGENIKEKPRIDALPEEQLAADPEEAAPETAPAKRQWVYYKVVLQSPVIGPYRLLVTSRRRFDPEKPVTVEPILAAGKLSDQSGQVAIAKADTLAIGKPELTNLIPADPGSDVDLPFAPHRRIAALAFKYPRPPFALSLPVARQVEAAVITTMATAAIVEQVLDDEGRLNGRVVYLLKTSTGDRMRISLPDKAVLLGVEINGAEAPVENTDKGDEKVVRLPPTAGQVTQVVLDIRYSMTDASARSLAVPALPEDVAFQMTFWRVWVPQDDYVLAHDRIFTPLSSGEAQNLVAHAGQGQPAKVGFALTGQGRLLDFQRQGPPGELSVTLAGRRMFAIVTWAIILAAGAVMLKLSGFQRTLIVLGAVMALAVLQLFAQPLVEHFVTTGWLAMVVVLAAWLAQGVFRLLRNRPKPAAASPPPPVAQGQDSTTQNTPTQE